jgi:hypothetical protein
MRLTLHLAIDSHGEDQDYITQPFKTQFGHKLHMMFLSGTNSYNWSPISRPVMALLQEQYKNNNPTSHIMSEFKKECLRAYDAFGIDKLEQLTKEALDEKSMSEEVKKVIKRASAHLKKTPMGEIGKDDRICYHSGAIVNRLYSFTPLDRFKKDDAVDSYGVSINGKSFAGSIMILRVGINETHFNTPFNLIGNEPIPLLENARQHIRDTLYYNKGQITLTDILKHLTAFDTLYVYDLGCRAPSPQLVRSTTTVFAEEKESGKLLKNFTTDSQSESHVALHVNVNVLLELIDLTELIINDPFFSDLHDQARQFKMEAMNGHLTEHHVATQIAFLNAERQHKTALLDTYHNLTRMHSTNSRLESLIRSLAFETTRKNIEMSISQLNKLKPIDTLIQLKNEYCHGAFFKNNVHCDDTDRFIEALMDDPFSDSYDLHSKIRELEIYLTGKKELLDELKETAEMEDDPELHEFIKDLDSKSKEEITDILDRYRGQIIQPRSDSEYLESLDYESEGKRKKTRKNRYRKKKRLRSQRLKR